MFSSERNLHTAAGEKDRRAEAARKASRQRYKLKCKKQIRMGRSGRMPPHSCMRGSSITQCEFITWTDRWAEKGGGGAFQVRGTKKPGRTRPDWLACTQMSVTNAVNYTADSFKVTDPRSYQTIRRITFHCVTCSLTPTRKQITHTHTSVIRIQAAEKTRVGDLHNTLINDRIL